MGQGVSVVMNGSREALPAALRAYPDLLPVLVTVPEDVLRRRLEARGREDAADMERRLARARMAVPEVPALVRFDNSGPLNERGRALADLILDNISP
jgi:ribose 1,5-bisphosphokinase